MTRNHRPVRTNNSVKQTISQASSPIASVALLLHLFFLTVALSCVSNGVRADEVYVPKDLEPWQEWVMHDTEYVGCPMLGSDYRCSWPGRLTLDVMSDGARFKQSIEVFSAQHVNLPGDIAYWPLDVTVNGRSLPVVQRNGRPSIYLEQGQHVVAGVFSWQRRPDTLRLDNGTGLLALSIDGQAIERPRWNASQIWISQGPQPVAATAENRISASVYRLVTDGAPVEMLVSLQLDIAGDSREETIGQLVPDGFTPAGLSAPLPARLDDDGNLKIQARPGSWVFRFVAHAPAPLQRLTLTPRGEHWPVEEVWSYQAAPNIRATEVRADNAVDPVQAGVPEQWRAYPAFQMNAADEMTVIERQRGRAASEKNRLSLSRELWLDFDRTGYTARDRITGSMVRDWRLDMNAPFQLESARIMGWDGEEDNLLVTQAPENTATSGVELRTSNVNLSTLARLESSTTLLPVAGWDARFDSVNTQLFLPPGYRLLAASNVDSAPTAWASRWNLLDFFVVMIVTVSVWRLIAPWAGIIALFALCLSFHESGAPQRRRIESGGVSTT